MRQEKRPHHRTSIPVHCCVVDSIPEAAEKLSLLIRRNRRYLLCATFLFVDDQKRAFAITEDRSVALSWVSDHFDWLVGRYDVTPRGKDSIPNLDPEQLAEDLAEHLAQLLVPLTARQSAA